MTKKVGNNSHRNGNKSGEKQSTVKRDSSSSESNDRPHLEILQEFHKFPK